ncbi:hypothetical protein JOC27_000475 [Sporolactobacillus spathodeae]|uniref:Uncharacterized protein n=1 Tax=Sporolactobacillus spathodeae TaxID=1465502 RepID=A0ABS2Q5H1_9BACL|nr:hypothetical protein [Sporolactobacillus spathodeae]
MLFENVSCYRFLRDKKYKVFRTKMQRGALVPCGKSEQRSAIVKKGLSYFQVFLPEKAYIHSLNRFVYIAIAKIHLCHISEPFRTNLRATLAIGRATIK